MNLKFSNILLLTLIAIASNTASAVEFSVQVFDQLGKPLANTVIESPGTPISVAPDTVAVMDQVNKRFVPMVIAIGKGQSVNFPNYDNIRHHVYSFSDIKQFSTELYADIPANPVQFESTGVAALGCNIHDSMVGYIYVSEWEDVQVTDDSGIVRFTQDALPDEISVWHPWSTDANNRRAVSTASVREGGILEVRLNITSPNQAFGFRALSTE